MVIQGIFNQGTGNQEIIVKRNCPYVIHNVTLKRIVPSGTIDIEFIKRVGSIDFLILKKTAFGNLDWAFAPDMPFADNSSAVIKITAAAGETDAVHVTVVE